MQFKNLKLIQDTQLFCFGTDAVLLADFAKVPPHAKVVDLGTGTGILPILMYGRQPDADYAGVEIQEKLCCIAQRSVELNGLADKIRICCGNIRTANELFGGENDVVVANPPYEKAEDGEMRNSKSHQIARKEIRINFEEICAAAESLLRPGGKFYLIHKTARLAELIWKLKERRLEPKELRFVHAHLCDEPKYVLIYAVKHARESLHVLPPLVVHHEDGSETEEMKKIYHRREE